MNLPDIRIVPIDQVYIHEEIFRDKVHTIKKLMDYSGVQKNPILTVEHKGKFIVIDGMHRVAALKELGCRMIAVCVYDYYHPDLNLYGWSVLFYGPEEEKFIDLLRLITGVKVTREEINSVIRSVNERSGYFAVAFKDRDYAYLFHESGSRIETEDLMKIDKNVMINIEQKGIRHRFIPDTNAFQVFRSDEDASALMIRPVYEKKEVIEFALKRKLFPQKSTRHEIPDRPLWLNIPLTLLRADIPVDVANEILKAEIRYRWKQGRIRYYPESVYIFDD